MKALEFLKDKDFLRALDNRNNRFYWVRIEVLDSNELPIKNIEGRVQSGSTININGDSAVRRTCNISFIAEEEKNDLTDIDNLLSANKRIRIYEGFRNDISDKYDKVIWFPLGIFIINQPNISHSSSGCIIQLNCKDKMCLLNGESAGGLPTSITFHEYEQTIGERKCTQNPLTDTNLQPNNYTIYSYNGKYYSWTPEKGWKQESGTSSVGDTVSVPQLFYDIIQTLVCNYGGISLDKVFINDVPLQIKQIVRYVGNNTLYYNTATGTYTTDESYISEAGTWRTFKFNEDVGYVYTDFTYPGSLVSGIGDTVCSVLDKIKNTLGNYEYYFDIEGNFIFQEKRNYLNNSYNPTYEYRLDNYGKEYEDGRQVKIASNGLSVIDNTNYEVDFYSNTKSVYTFTEGNGLVIAFTNTPNYNNLKNDFHIWGENDDGYAIHYHLAIKNKPTIMNTYKVVFIQKNDKYTGGLRLATVLARDGNGNPTRWEDGAVDYIPSDWRAELYLQGLTKQQNQMRPDVYEQELLDLFDSIYDFEVIQKDKNGNIIKDENGNPKRGEFKTDLVYHPNDLKYFFDYLEPISSLYDCSVDVLGTKIYSYKLDKINQLYNVEIPNIIMIDLNMDSNSRQQIIARCEREGQPYSNVDSNIYAKVAVGTTGYTAQETSRELLYQYTNYNESISIQSIPIYYLEVNTRITVQDRKSGIYGDYIIKNISLPLDAGSTMTINASRALERI